jgi:plasmid stability protein
MEEEGGTMAVLNVKGFPDGLYKKIRILSKKENRSLSQQVIYILRNALEEKESMSILDLRGLGKEMWRDVDAASHVRAERNSWD